MTRIGKVQKRRNQKPKKRHYPLHVKTGTKKDNLKKGYKEKENAISGEIAKTIFIPKIS